MSLNESIVEGADLEWFLLRQGYGVGYAVWHGAAFAELRRAKPILGPGELTAVRATTKYYLPARFARKLNP